LVLLAVAGCTVLHGVQLWGSRGKSTTIRNYFPVPLQLFLIVFLALPFLPDQIWLRQYVMPLSLLSQRFTLAIAILGCCALASLRPRILLVVLTGCIALTYFALVYQDAARTYAMEEQAEVLVAKLPQGARVLTTIYPFRGSRLFVEHVMDRVCIGRCFNIDNYEASTAQFRLRANPGNRIVSANPVDAAHMVIGDYVVRLEDLPLWQVFQCGPTQVDLCVRPLHAGSLRNLIPSEVERARRIN